MDIKHLQEQHMRFFQMSALNTADSTGVFLISHRRMILKSGQPLGAEFNQPMILKLDEEQQNGRMPTFYESPALIATKAFHRDLEQSGVSNIETFPVKICNTSNGAENHDYVLINILSRVSCFDMNQSKHRSLGPEMTIVDTPILKSGLITNLNLFVADEDTDIMIVSEQVYRYLTDRNYKDIIFRELHKG
jgi:hypothetical protein